jgi:hypothetical protein
VSVERRKHPRFKVNVPVEVTLEGDRIAGQLRDVCRDAALVELSRTLPMGSELALAASLPGASGPLQVVGRVVRLGRGEAGGQDVAILFTNMTPAAETEIDFFIARQAPEGSA